MIRDDAVGLYRAILNAKSSGIPKESLPAYFRVRMALKAVNDEFNDFLKEVTEQTKPEPFDDKPEQNKLWNDRRDAVIQEWARETVEIDTRVLTFDTCVSFLAGQDLPGLYEDMILRFFVREKSPDAAPKKPAAKKGNR